MSVPLDAPVLNLPQCDKRLMVATDAYGYCVDGVLSRHRSDCDHPFAYFPKKMAIPELTCPTNERGTFCS